MHSNFEFLENDWEQLAGLGKIAEKMLFEDLNTVGVKVRQIGEFIASAILKYERIPEKFRMTQEERINSLKSNGLIDETIENIFHYIRKKGNGETHYTIDKTATLSKEDAELMLSFTIKLCSWFKELYGNDYSFDSSKIEYHTPIVEDYKSLYLNLKENLKQETFLAEIDENKTISSEVRAEKRKKIKNKLSEKETREIIDLKLRNQGWIVDSSIYDYKNKGTLPEKGKNMAIAEWPCRKNNGNIGYADYAFFIGTTLIGLMEAKAYDVDISSALEQDCKMYAKDPILDRATATFIEGTPFRDYKVPFLFASNGREYNPFFIEKSGILFYDSRKLNNPNKAIKDFPSPNDLLLFMKKDIDEAKAKLEKEDINLLKHASSLGLREYQIEAIKSVEENILKGNKTTLLTMATGTGKTRTAIALIYRLLKTRMYNRILFLVDRSALGEQTLDSMKDCKISQSQSLYEMYDIKELKDIKVEGDTRLHIATVQGLIKRVLYSGDNKASIGQYDCIIIDEAHRGYIGDGDVSEEELEYKDEKDFIGKYKAVIDYFEADKIALTATPALHTVEIFGEPVYDYSYRRAVLEGYLVDYEPPHSIKTKLMSDGITFEKDETIQIYDTGTQTVKTKTLQDELTFEIENFNRQVINESFVRVVCKELTKRIPLENLGKTLIFAVNNTHADMIVRILKEEYRNEYSFDKSFYLAEDCIKKITGEVKDVQTEIKRFKIETYPKIAVTVDLLTTGIDVPEICNIVFMRKVKSIILYEQMLGRATRKCDDIEKDHFNIFDCVALYDTLKNYSQMKYVQKRPSATFTDLTEMLVNNPESFENIKDEIIAKLQRKKVHIKKSQSLQNIFKAQSNDLSFEDYITKIDNIKTFEDLVKEVELIKTIDELKLRASEFVLSTKEDELLEVKRGYGKNNSKPDDYLEGFRKFIQSTDIDAIKVYRNNPKSFGRKDLKYIMSILDNEGYSEQSVKAAYKELTNEEITAIILAFIKNAIRDLPITDFEEKVDIVMKKINKLRPWEPKQKNILELIKKQLLANQIIGYENLNEGIFNDRYAGAESINKILDNMLGEILNLIQEEILLN